MRGITSWGKKKKCGGDESESSSVYGVYTDVTVVENWIRGVIEKQPDTNRLNFESHDPEEMNQVKHRTVVH